MSMSDRMEGETISISDKNAFQQILFAARSCLWIGRWANTFLFSVTLSYAITAVLELFCRKLISPYVTSHVYLISSALIQLISPTQPIRRWRLKRRLSHHVMSALAVNCASAVSTCFHVYLSRRYFLGASLSGLCTRIIISEQRTMSVHFDSY